MASVSFSAGKQNLIQQITDALALQGYTDNPTKRKSFISRLRALTGSKTVWNPDIFLMGRNNTILIADTQMIEEGHSQYISDIMEQAVPSIRSILRSPKIALFVPLGGILDPDTIQKAVALDVTVASMDRGAVHEVLQPSSISQVHRATRRQRQEVARYQTSGRILPEVLVSKVERIRSVAYSENLRRFSGKYSHTPKTVTLNVQYDLALRCVEGILRQYNLQDWCRHLDISMGLDKMARLKGELRDHFLHQFQTFLMGSIILNEANSHKTNMPSFRLSNTHQELDLPWLITSIFHDYGYGIAHIESCVDPGICGYRIETRNNSRYSAMLNSFFDCARNGKDIDTWNPDSYAFENADLEGALFNAALDRTTGHRRERKRPNHGVLSAHKILSMGEPIIEQEPDLRPILLSSALSVAIHDKDLWAELFSKSVLPFDATRFPLSYLLTLCDTLAEAGRPRTENTSHQDDALLDFSIDGHNLDCQIWFAEPRRALTMNYWADFVQRRCFQNALLNIDLKCFK
jgi:hypothetical protein